MLTQLIQEMKKEELLGDYTEDHVTYELSQLCAQVYLYKGYILQDRYKYQLENRHPYLLMEHDFKGTAEEIFMPCLPFSKERIWIRKFSGNGSS